MDTDLDFVDVPEDQPLKPGSLVKTKDPLTADISSLPGDFKVYAVNRVPATMGTYQGFTPTGKGETLAYWVKHPDGKVAVYLSCELLAQRNGVGAVTAYTDKEIASAAALVGRHIEMTTDLPEPLLSHLLSFLKKSSAALGIPKLTALSSEAHKKYGRT